MNKNILTAIGGTSLIQLRRVVPESSGKIFVKLECQNPTGSMKDRAALAMISKAEANGCLKPGFRILEYTGGSTGISLALICTAKGYQLKIITSDAFSRDKLDQVRAFGAELKIIPSEGGVTTKKLIQDMIEAAREESDQPDTYWTNQLYNRDSITGYYSLGEEILQQMDGKIDAFVRSVGTSASLMGTAEILKEYSKKIKTTAVEPAESAILSGGKSGPHKIEGVGIGFIAPLWNPSMVDNVISVKTADAMEMARRLAREEGIFAGTSSGANVIAAIKTALQLGSKSNVVTLIVDTGLRYMSTGLFNNA